MKVQTINVQITKTPRPYESIKIGGEWSLEAGETEEQAMAEALAMLNRFYDSLSRQPQQAATQQAAASTPATTTEKQRITMADNLQLVKRICKKIEGGVSLDTVLKYYEPDEEVLRVLLTAGALNTPTDGGDNDKYIKQQLKKEQEQCKQKK